MFIDSALVTILNKYRAVDATLTKSVKYAMLNAAKAQCWTPVSERDIDAGDYLLSSNQFTLPMIKIYNSLERCQILVKFLANDLVSDNPYMNPMGLTFREFVQHVIQQYKVFNLLMQSNYT